MSNNIIELKNIVKKFDRMILNELNLTIKNGSSTAVLGETGCGKSTLLNILSLFETFDTGEYLLNDIDVKIQKKKYPKIRNENFGFVFQSYNLIDGLSVSENIKIPLEYSDKRDCGEESYYKELILKLSLSDKTESTVDTLSGGEKQRVAIARALINKPQIIFADEPTGNLDTKTKADIISLFCEINKNFGTTLFVVTHDQNVAKAMDNIYLLEKETGKLKKA
ncbi:MAG: ABC transporter ATP-binding protein [Clostridiales bacterium]|jgi:ABC-type lipoprotein export system ATPase subunit|nr:ABC transporter ATP-binding protein [Clostridiales bacterium]